MRCRMNTHSHKYSNDFAVVQYAILVARIRYPLTEGARSAWLAKLSKETRKNSEIFSGLDNIIQTLDERSKIARLNTASE